MGKEEEKEGEAKEGQRGGESKGRGQGIGKGRGGYHHVSWNNKHRLAGSGSACRDIVVFEDVARSGGRG